MPILLSCAGVSLAIGVGLAWNADEHDNAPTQTSAPAMQVPIQAGDRPTTLTQFSSLWGKAGSQPVISERSAGVDELWARALLPPEKLKAGEDAQDTLRKLAQANPAVMKNLLGRYGRETDPHARDVLRALLSTIETPEVLAFSKQLVTSADATQRKDGLAMLQNFSVDPHEVRNIIKQTLATEQDPGVLIQALSGLKRSAPSAQPAADVAEAEAIVTQLKNLTQNADPAVRSQSILQLAQWDKNGTGENTLSRALTDQTPEVRQAAIFAIAQSGSQSDGAKTALLGMIGNVNESKDVRGSALQVLERFALSKEESAKVAQVRSQVLGL